MSIPTSGERAFAPGAGIEPEAVAHARDVLNTIASLDWPEPERVSLLARLARSARADVGTVMARLALARAPLSSFPSLIAVDGLAEKRVRGLARALARVDPRSFSQPVRLQLDAWSRLDALRAENDALRVELDKALAHAKQIPAGEPALERMRLREVADSITRQLELANHALSGARRGLRLGAVTVELRGKAAAVSDDVALDFAVPGGGSVVGLSFGPAPPTGTSGASESAGTVPDVTGYTAALARRKLERAGYGVLATGASGAGVVTAQSPRAGSSAALGAVVRIVLG